MARTDTRGRGSGPLSPHNWMWQLLASAVLVLALGAGVVFGQGRTLWQDGQFPSSWSRCREPIAATSDSAGGAIVVWTDTRSWPEGIYAQRVNGSGLPLWTENGVLLCDSIEQTLNSDAADDGRHGAIVAWAPYGFTLAVQRVSAEGVPLWGADGLTLRPYADSMEELPALMHDGHGGAIVVWAAIYNPLSIHVDTLIACRVDSSGTKSWETVVRIDTLGVVSPRLCSDGEGGVIVAWSEYESGVWRVQVQRIDSAGAIRWGTPGVLACTLSTTQDARACVAAGESCFVVGFYVHADGVWKIRSQMLDLAGNRRWGPGGAPVTGTANSVSGCVGLPAVGNGQSIWLWSENRTGTTDLFAQKLDSTGTRCWDSAGAWLGSSDTSSGLGFGATGDGEGGTVAAWTLYRSRLNWDIHAQHADSGGLLCWSDTGLAVCPGDNNVRSPVCASDGNGGAIVAWDDDRGLYAQRVADGAGIEESYMPQATSHKPGATVVRGALVLGAVDSRQDTAYGAELLDVSGRTVLNLHSGANDVSRLAPGVYFIREVPTASTPRSQVVRKVIVTG